MYLSRALGEMYVHVHVHASAEWLGLGASGCTYISTLWAFQPQLNWLLLVPGIYLPFTFNEFLGEVCSRSPSRPFDKFGEIGNNGIPVPTAVNTYELGAWNSFKIITTFNSTLLHCSSSSLSKYLNLSELGIEVFFRVSNFEYKYAPREKLGRGFGSMFRRGV